MEERCSPALPWCSRYDVKWDKETGELFYCLQWRGGVIHLSIDCCVISHHHDHMLSSYIRCCWKQICWLSYPNTRLNAGNHTAHSPSTPPRPQLLHCRALNATLLGSRVASGVVEWTDVLPSSPKTQFPTTLCEPPLPKGLGFLGRGRDSDTW